MKMINEDDELFQKHVSAPSGPNKNRIHVLMQKELLTWNRLSIPFHSDTINSNFDRRVIDSVDAIL